MILVLPWYPMWKLQMPLRRKLSICAIFLFGGFVVAAGIVRLAYVIQANKKNAEGLHSTGKHCVTGHLSQYLNFARRVLDLAFDMDRG